MDQDLMEACLDDSPTLFDENCKSSITIFKLYKKLINNSICAD